MASNECEQRIKADERLAVNGLWERIERMGTTEGKRINGWLSMDFGNELKDWNYA